MASILRQLKERFYPSHEHRITILGLSPAGKTTLLYYLKTGEIVATIPSIGFNIETIEVATSSGKLLRMQAWDVGTGCGISYLYHLIRVYLASSDALIWVVDSSDETYLPESVESLEKIVSSLDSDCTVGQEVLPPKDVPILILANKSDLPNKTPLDKIRISFSKVISGRLSAVYSSCSTEGTPVKNSGLPEAFDWLLLAMEIQRSRPKKSTQKIIKPPMFNPSSENDVMRKLESWLNRINTDLETEVFLERFRSFALPSWDHYTHIRIAYVLLTKYGRKEGKDLIFEGLEKYISVSQQTTGKSFHVTMTYFWIQIVHFGIRNMPTSPNNAMTTSALSVDPSSALSQSASPNDFADFLLLNPHIADGNLWSDYYTKTVMMSPQAKSEMVLPDKRPLPNLVIRDAILKYKSSK